MKEFGLIGYPLSHSFSQEYFTKKFKSLGLNYQYKLFPIHSIDILSDILANNPNLMGINVTIPHKQNVLKHLDLISEEVKKIGAANTLKKLPDGRWKGFNTDVIGFVKAVEKVTEKKAFERSILIGNGGASKAVHYALTHHFNCQNIIVACRNPIASHELFISDLSEEMIAAADIIVQCTPVGMYPNVDNMLMIPYYAFHSQQIVMDLIYNPEQTHFVRYATQRGCTIASGLDMLYAQANASFEIWMQD
ncbi:MAG: shikimate dehydrogenase [Bacteroidia bacterium]|nr:shikimate dehydrogenase [Bacteroidia bacterium]MDW8346266.1 shikimate dehydrogenase [Bacteroidia bacterium]